MELELTHVAGLLALGLVAGFLNTVGGGGSLLTLPLLTFMGMDLAVANATNRIGIFLQCAASTWTFRSQGVFSLRKVLPLGIAACAGSALGAFLAIQIDKRALNLAIGVLISVMAVLLVAKPRMWEERKVVTWPKWAVWMLFAAIGVYGGFIQAGVGFFLSWGLAGAAGYDLVSGNGAKSFIVFLYTAVSLVLFFAGGLVNVPVGLILSVGGMAGAVLGARFAVAKGNTWIRWILAGIICVTALKMALDAFAH